MTPAEFAGRMERAASDLREGSKLLEKIGLVAEASAKRNISGPNKAVKTGNLRRSITSRVVNGGVYVGTAVEYAQYIHDGTRWIKPRPFLKEGIEDAIDEIRRIVEDFGGQVLEQVAGR